MWWLAVLVCAALGAGARAAAGSWLTDIGRDLRSDMAGVLELAESVEYSTPVINVTYIASVEFDMRAMGPVYNSTHLVIDAIAHKQAYPEGIVSVSDGHLELTRPLREEWRPLLAHYAGPVAVLAVAAVLVVALPLAGLFWCCCHWCRTRRRRPFDRKCDACLKGVLAIVLIALLTLFLFGVVCAFATDSQVESGTAAAPQALRAGLHDAREFLNATQAHARWLLVVNYRELERQLGAMLASSGVTISVKLGEFSRAASVTTLSGMVHRLADVRRDLRVVRNLTADLRAKAERLNAALRSVKGQLLQTLARCDAPQCAPLKEKYRIGQLDTEIHYSQMPDVSELLNNVTALLESNITAEVEEGQKVFRDIQREVRRSVDTGIPDVSAALADTGRRLEATAERVSALAGNASAALQRHGARAADATQRAHAEYGAYRRYAGLGAAGALLAVTVLLALGLVCGVCGKRPDVYGASDCCNKGAGSKCLLCGVALLLFAGGAVALVLLVYFAAGVAAQRFLCDPLTEPRGNRLFEDLDRFVDLERQLFDERASAAPALTATAALLRCHANHTVYQVLELHRLLDLEGARAQLAAQVARRVEALRPPARRPAPVTILRASAKLKLRALADTGLSDFDFDRILHALETNMTSLALDSLGAQLDSTARAVRDRAELGEVAAALRDASARLAACQRDLVRPMHDDTALLNATATKLRDMLRFNHSSLKEAVSYLMHETEQAEQFLNTQGPELVHKMTQDFAGVVAQRLDEYLQRVARAAEHEVGRCGPLSHAFNATRDAHCRRILMPVNGYWMSLAWCTLLLVPVLLAARRLARLYLHVDPYPGPLVEAEYLYDAYADRDNVPLANAYKAEKRAGREARRGAGGGGGGSGVGVGGGAGAAREAAPVATPVDAHHARRYNDMAPKHWEEGPPRYHGPTEYERPPPYYYPGPIDRQ